MAAGNMSWCFQLSLIHSRYKNKGKKIFPSLSHFGQLYSSVSQVMCLHTPKECTAAVALACLWLCFFFWGGSTACRARRCMPGTYTIIDLPMLDFLVLGTSCSALPTASAWSQVLLFQNLRTQSTLHFISLHHVISRNLSFYGKHH